MYRSITWYTLNICSLIFHLCLNKPVEGGMKGMWGKLLSEKEIQRLQHWLIHETWIFNKCYLFGEKNLKNMEPKKRKKEAGPCTENSGFPIRGQLLENTHLGSPHDLVIHFIHLFSTYDDGHLPTCTLTLGSEISLMLSSLKMHWTLISWLYRGKKPECGEGKWCSQGFISSKWSQRRRFLQRPGPLEKKLPLSKREMSHQIHL